MTELQMTKAIVKLPRKNSSANRHSQLVDVNSNHETLVVDDFLVTDKLYIDGSPSSVIETEIRDLVLSYKPIR
jgi:hypothetical protein